MKALRCAAALILLVVPAFAQAITIETFGPPPVQQPYNRINLNKADVHDLTHSFKGIGKKRAQAIVNYRVTHGQFRSIQELARVKGIGKRFVSVHLRQLQEVFTVD